MRQEKVKDGKIHKCGRQSRGRSRKLKKKQHKEEGTSWVNNGG